MSKRKVERGDTRVCSPEFGVVTLTSSGGSTHLARNRPCEECPWRKDSRTHRFPPDAFRESAKTAYDAALTTFGCHMSPHDAPATCAGFLLRHSENNIRVRLSRMEGRIDLSRINDGGVEIYESYREMAVANGVPADDPSLDPVRADGESFRRRGEK